MSYITTVTGKHFDPMDPGNHDFNIVDIAHALSLICRGNGHIRFFYSVAQHSIACAEEAVARGYSPEVILGCLLHDASEAYLSDVTRPVKKELPQYLMAEEKLQRAIDKDNFIRFRQDQLKLDADKNFTFLDGKISVKEMKKDQKRDMKNYVREFYFVKKEDVKQTEDFQLTVNSTLNTKDFNQKK